MSHATRLLGRERRRHRAERRSAAAAHPTAVVPLRGRLLADALIHNLDVEGAAATFGRCFARDGEGLDVCLGELDDVCAAVQGTEAPPPLVRCVALAWADTLQGHFNGITCADPLTGLASIQHVQTQVADLYRAAQAGWLGDADVARSHVLVVVELPVAADLPDGPDEPGEAGGPRGPGRYGALEAALRRATAAELVRQRMPECDQPAQLTARRLVALARRSPDLHRRLVGVVGELDQRLTLTPGAGLARAWAESLPSAPENARRLVDELAR